MLQLNTVSSHRGIGVLEGQHAQMVEDDLIAWHAQEDNQAWLGIEFCQPLPTDEYSDWQIQTGIAVVKAWCRKYNIIPSATTIMPHSGTAQGKRNGKSDPGRPFPLTEFIARLS